MNPEIEDEELLLSIAIIVAAKVVQNNRFMQQILISERPIRSPSLYRQRWQSDYLTNLAIREDTFVSEYRLTPQAFDRLLHTLEPYLQVDNHMSQLAMSRTGSAFISKASRVAVTLIILAGGRVIEAMRTHGIAKTSAHVIFYDVINAINSAGDLAIICDNSPNALAFRAEGFKARSTMGLFNFATGAIDGLAITIKAPSREETRNQLRFRSGSKNKYCLNMQGVCDANCRFIAMSCMHAGSTNDVQAFETCHLKNANETQVEPYHWVGDAAYTSTNTMMVPYTGVNLHVTNPELDSFNFWQSQIRITIERCFGIFVRRWGIFWKSLSHKLGNVANIVHACCRLHNFCIDNSQIILNNSYTPPALVAVDENGILTNAEWRRDRHVGVIRSDGVRVGNALAELLVEIIRERGLYHSRSHH